MQSDCGWSNHLLVLVTPDSLPIAGKCYLDLFDTPRLKNITLVGQQAQDRGYRQHRGGKRLRNGISTVRVNCGSAVVGDYEQVADKLLNYW